MRATESHIHTEERTGVREYTVQMASLDLFLVKFDFEATKSDELSIKPGDQIIILDQSGSDWWFGRNKATGQEVCTYI